MNYNTIIFDLDGVIVSTDDCHYAAWRTLAERLHIPFSPEDNDRLRGVSRMESLDILLEKSAVCYTEEQKRQFAQQKNERYLTLLSKITPKDLDAEIWKTLEALRAGGLKLAIGSSSKNAPFILERLGLDGWFDAVADGNQIVRSKPNPEVFLLAARLLGRTPKECLVVEDAVAGLQAARAAGMDCAAIGDAADSPLATYPLESFSQLTTIVLGGRPTAPEGG